MEPDQLEESSEPESLVTSDRTPGDSITESSIVEYGHSNPNSTEMPCKRKTEAMIFADEAKKPIKSLPPKRSASAAHHTYHIIPNTGSSAKSEDVPLWITEKRDIYIKEKVGWITNKAYERVERHTVHNEANIIGSHVVYNRKPDRTAKERIVP